MRHRHEEIPERARTVAYHGPVRRDQFPRAHGNVCQIDVCACGATRKSNRNASAIEMGRWQS